MNRRGPPRNVNAASGSNPKRGRGNCGNVTRGRGRGTSSAPAPPPSLAEQWIQAVMESGDEARRKMTEFRNKPVQPCKYVDWAPLREVDEYEAIVGMLSYDVEINGVSHTMHDWKQLVELEAPVYPVLTREFLATVRFHLDDPGNNDYLTFRLGGEERSLTGYEFCRIMGLYRGKNNEFIKTLLQDAETIPLEFEKHAGRRIFGTFCNDISYKASTTKASELPNPHHRCLQRFLANTINFRKVSNEKCNSKDVWLMSRILNKTRVHIPNFLIRQFTDEKYRKSISPLYGGHFVTLIARHFNIDFSHLPPPLPMDLFTQRSYVKGLILKVRGKKLFRMEYGVVPPEEVARVRASVGNESGDDEHPQEGGDIPMPEAHPEPQQPAGTFTGITEAQMRALFAEHFGGLNLRLNSIDGRIGGLETRLDTFQANLDAEIAERRRRFPHDQPPQQD